MVCQLVLLIDRKFSGSLWGCHEVQRQEASQFRSSSDSVPALACHLPRLESGALQRDMNLKLTAKSWELLSHTRTLAYLRD